MRCAFVQSSRCAHTRIASMVHEEEAGLEDCFVPERPVAFRQRVASLQQRINEVGYEAQPLAPIQKEACLGDECTLVVKFPLLQSGSQLSDLEVVTRKRLAWSCSAATAGFGLGQLLHYGRELNAMDQVIGAMMVIVLIGLLADRILFAPWERFLHRRWGMDGR